MNIKELKNEDFINFVSETVGYRIEMLRPKMTRSGGIVVVEFEEPDNAFAQTAYEKFTFTKDSCKRQNNFKGIQNISNSWINYVNGLNQSTTATL